MSSACEPAVLSSASYLALEAHYKDYPLALYTGAGVSWSDDPRYGMGGWDDLVRRVLADCVGVDSAAVAEFDQRVAREWSEEPWQMAEWVATRCGRDAFATALTAVVQQAGNFQRTYKQLSGRYLRAADTLNAVSAFCTQLTGVVEGTHQPTYRVAPNHRVCAVVTSNYDPYLEAASSTMFIEPVLKPVAAFGSHAGDLEQIPVFHIHSYVPFPTRVPGHTGKEVTPLTELVITTQDYERAWRPDDVYCPTMGAQIHVLRYYAVLFIGFSFRDQWVNGLLQRLNEEREKRMPDDRLYHYAFVHEDTFSSRGERFYDDLGVKPIVIGGYDEIPVVLGHLYRQALAHDYGDDAVELPVVEKRTGEKTGEHTRVRPTQYWADLRACRTRAAGRSGVNLSSSVVTGDSGS